MYLICLFFLLCARYLLLNSVSSFIMILEVKQNNINLLFQLEFLCLCIPFKDSVVEAIFIRKVLLIK